MRLSRFQSPVALTALVLGLVGCGGPGGKGPGKTDAPTGPVWERGKPTIDGRDMVPGFPYNLNIGGVPVGGPVQFYQSIVGPGAGACVDDFDAVCLGIEQAELVAEGAGDGDGKTVFPVDVAIDEEPRVIWFQGVVTDPETGAMTTTSVLQRHIAVPPSEATVSFHVVDAAAGLEIPVGGNSHTGGNAWVDINGDYLDDLFVTNSTGRQHRLFLNNGDKTFTDWSARVAKTDLELEDAGVSFGDIDNDGDEDILVVVDSPLPMNALTTQLREGGPNLLYLNNGDGTFTESAEAWGLTDPRGWRSSCITLGDYDRDGLLDAYVCSWAMNSEPLGLQDKTDRLLRNTGTAFVESDQGIDGYGRDALVARMADFDRDGWMDLYVGNVAEQNHPPIHDPRDVFYKNVDGVFEDRTEGGMGDGEDVWAAMGTTLGDIDNDGEWDFYVTDHWDYPPEPRGNALYRVKPDGTFTDNVCHEAGVCAGYLTWPANFADFDKDGWVDLWVGTAWSSHNDLVFMNRRDGTFELHAQEAMAGNATHGGSVADYDADGDLDIFLFSDIGRAHLYENDSPNEARWVELKLLGTTSNRSAIGALIRADNGNTRMMRMVSGGDSAHSQSSLTQHFGVGDGMGLTAEITWPSGKVMQIGPLMADRFYLVDEDQGVVDESLEYSEAVHDTELGTLTVRARSNYGGRSKLSVHPMNQPMVYNAVTRSHEVTVLAQDLPTSVTIESQRGNSWVQAVSEMP